MDKHAETKHAASPLSLRLILEIGLCSIAIGSYATILIHLMHGGSNLFDGVFTVFIGAVFSIGFSPLCLGVIPLDENFTNTLDASPAIAVSLAVLFGTALRQEPFPETAARIRRFGPLCGLILRVLRYTCYAWLIFIPVGTVLGILCIKYLRHPNSVTEKVPTAKSDTWHDGDHAEPDVGS